MIDFILSLSDLYGLFKAVKSVRDEIDSKKKVKDDIQAIKNAFKNKDSSYLDHIFNGVPDNAETKS